MQTCWNDGAITLASEKLLTFYGRVSNLLSFNELVALLESSFYPLYLAQQGGKAHIPSYVLKLLNSGEDMDVLYDQAIEEAGKDHYESTVDEILEKEN